MNPTARSQTIAWTLLVSATLMSFWASAHFGSQLLAIAAIMAIAAGKVIIVLRQFMSMDRVALPFKLYFYGWSVGCALFIFGVATIS